MVNNNISTRYWNITRDHFVFFVIQKIHRSINCLLQLHIAEEETKFGFSFGECREMLAAGTFLIWLFPTCKVSSRTAHRRVCITKIIQPELLTIIGFLNSHPAKVVFNVAMVIMFNAHFSYELCAINLKTGKSRSVWKKKQSTEPQATRALQNESIVTWSL